MQDSNNLGPALNWKQAIKQLGCSKSMFYRLVEEGEFPHAFRFGISKGIRVPKSDIDAYLEKRRVA